MSNFEEKFISEFRLALAMSDIGVSAKTAEHILQVYEAYVLKGDQYSLKDAVAIRCVIDEKYKPVLPEQNKGGEHV